MLCNKTTLLFIIFFVAQTSSFVVAQKPVRPVVDDVLLASEKEAMGGYLAKRLDAAYNNRILAQNVPKLIEPFKSRTEDRCWQTEFWGKWFTSAVLAYQYRPTAELKSLLDKAVTDLMATQTADGYIGNYKEEKRLKQWDIWGRKYCLLGLLSYYDITQNKKCLKAAQRLTDHLMQELKQQNALISRQGNHRGMAATSVLEPVCLLYRKTGEKKYLDFALEIVRQWETPDGPQLISKADVDVAQRFPKPASWWGWEQGQKAYEMMSCYEGLLELYRITGKEQYKRAVEKTWENIRNTEINITGSGSSVECWFGGKESQVHPVKKYQETCVTATWIKLSQQLLRLTGEARYADAIEQTYYNALLGAMHTDGSDWAKYSPLAGERRQGEEQCGMGINCCVASGPRGLFTLPQTVVMYAKEGVNINFFTEGRFQVNTPGNQVIKIIQSTEYPTTGDVQIKMELARPETFPLKVRIPEWSKQTSLTVNGKDSLYSIEAGYAIINRSWKKGDEVVVNLDMRGRVITLGERPSYLAVMRGPLVLARDLRFGGPHLEEILKPVVDKEGYCAIQPIRKDENGVWIQYKLPVTIESYEGEGGALPPSSIIMCDYASAGNTINEQSLFRVWLPQLITPE